ncbi:hypothetical protein N0V90_008466 [Kalmusia sp. IMI 367209]|nr:hypothetical protein N0V90_008466 [Kalmusia sp. IMI 367209]
MSRLTRMLQQTPTGTLTTAEGFEPKVEAEVVFGADWLYIDADKKYGRPNVKCIAKTNDGQTLAIDYTGVALLARKCFQVFEGDPDAQTIPFGLSVTEHRFQTGAAKYKFLENSQWVGNGRFIVSNDPRTVTVESRISQVVASTDMD